MTSKFAIAALLSVLAVPAFANGENPGNKMQADLLGLDASRFTTSELAQIASEDAGTDRIERIRLIAAGKANGAVTL